MSAAIEISPANHPVKTVAVDSTGRSRREGTELRCRPEKLSWRLDRYWLR